MIYVLIILENIYVFINSSFLLTVKNDFSVNFVYMFFVFFSSYRYSIQHPAAGPSFEFDLW